MNLQPSELMKIGLILFLANIIIISIDSINSLRLTFTSNSAYNFGCNSTDLGTSILIAGGVVVGAA